MPPVSWMHPDTKKVYETIIARKRPVRICDLSHDGHPVFKCVIVENVETHHHWLTIYPKEDNWVKVKPRSKK